MTEKEKAKAYDEAIERAKKSYGNRIAEEIFPELKESDDERIKKAIIEFFESEDDNTTYSLVRKKDIIAWLKKQGKNSIDKTKPRFDVGDWVVNKFGDSWHIDSLDKKNYQYLMEKETIIIFLFQNKTKCTFGLSKMQGMEMFFPFIVNIKAIKWCR